MNSAIQGLIYLIVFAIGLWIGLKMGERRNDNDL